MKSFLVGTKVEVLHSGNDNPADWVKATVVNIVSPNMEGIGESGNIVQLENGKYLTVTEPGMITKA